MTGWSCSIMLDIYNMPCFVDALFINIRLKGMPVGVRSQ